jgi:hypothetical protein
MCTAGSEFLRCGLDCSTDSKIGLSAVEKISTFCERVEIEKIGVPNIQTLVNTGIAIDKHMEE